MNSVVGGRYNVGSPVPLIEELPLGSGERINNGLGGRPGGPDGGGLGGRPGGPDGGGLGGRLGGPGGGGLGDSGGRFGGGGLGGRLDGSEYGGLFTLVGGACSPQ